MPNSNDRPAVSGTIDWSLERHLQYLHCGKTRLALEVEGPKSAQVISLRTPGENSKRKGTARAAMEHLCAKSDQQGVTLSLLASPLTKKTRLPRLVRFYASLGFQPNGRTGNWAGDPIMVRQPTNATEFRKPHRNPKSSGAPALAAIS